jgi:DNA helicase-2/ATP-dependent DNA helicase PcrA
MVDLSDQQRSVIELDADVFVTACPGSGKTRVLTEKIVATLEGGISPHQRIAALTFTNRAADEVAARLQERGYSRKQLWTGTIHSFALEWILRPYASYCDSLSRGFSVADEFYTRNLIASLKDKHGVEYTEDLRTGFDRDGNLLTENENERNLIEEYREHLQAKKLIDYDWVLYLAFDLLRRKSEIPKTLGAVFCLFCIDEYQDTQDLQFGILSSIVQASSRRSMLFIVGDKNQAIYSSLGGMAKTIQEIKDEFGRPELYHRELSGNYRSTQRIVDFCANLCEAGDEQITSMAAHSGERGLITISDQIVHKDNLAGSIAEIVQYHLARGIKAEDICIMGPRWWLLTQLGRQLVIHLPDVDLDAPGLSPLRYQPDSMWFKLARLFLTDATPSRYRTRVRWAADFVNSLEVCLGKELSEEKRSSRSILRLTNGRCPIRS